MAAIGSSREELGTLQQLDIDRAEALAAYLAEIHGVQHEEPRLWRILTLSKSSGRSLMASPRAHMAPARSALMACLD
ncbi:MAG: hypothetical protein M8467_03745 [Anaerolineae bacterium]|nr:hypothetical protein [Anaerolineae bacterium]